MINPSTAGPNLETAGVRGGIDRAKVLLVDDLKDNLLALEGLLRRDNLEIFKAKSGVEALECMIPHEFAVALIDVQMPGMSGFELAELMRGAKKTKHIPIIFVTATAKNQGFKFKGYESGAVDFLDKPLDTHAVKSKVDVFIELFLNKKELKNQLETITLSHKEQETLLAELKRTQIDLEHAVQTRDEFMSIASHELKTPLTALKLQSQLRKRGLKNADPSFFTLDRLTKMFDSDEQQVDRINHLIDDMLDVSRVRAGQLSMNCEQLDLCVLVRVAVERCREQLVAAGCLIEIDIEDCRPIIGSWDRIRIEQVIMNLLTNAMRYGAGGPVFVQVRADHGTARIVVRNQGRGIAKENQERIFQKFERATAGKETRGLGLGLYIVSHILEAHHGSIRVESELGQGATFVVELPIFEQNMGLRHEVPATCADPSMGPLAKP